MLQTIKVPNTSGDTQHAFSLDNPQQREAARKMVENHLAAGDNNLAFRFKEGTKEGEIIKQYDPTADTIILSEPVYGG